MNFQEAVEQFLRLCQLNKVRMIMVGGGAVNFHGYQRHSADVDFWIDLSHENLQKLRQVLTGMEYEFQEFPENVQMGLQNISIKISPGMDIELITRFNPGKSFDEAYESSRVATLVNDSNVSYRVLNYSDLIESKLKSARPKDLLDVQELRRLHGEAE